LIPSQFKSLLNLIIIYKETIMLEKVQIKAMKNGPLVIEGKAEITDENGDVNET